MKRMIYKLQKILSALIIAALFVELSGFVSQAEEWNAAEERIEVEVLEAQIKEDAEWPSGIIPRTMLINCTIAVSRDNDAMYIDISVGTVGVASVLGVKDIKIWKKNFWGGWDLVATSNGGEWNDRSIGGVTITYANAVQGATYKITCVHYGEVNGMEEYTNDSGAFVYNF